MPADAVASSPTLGFHVLGPLQLTIDGESQSLGGAKPRAVLAKLIISRNKVVSADAIADAAWDGNPPLQFRNHLQVTIAKLRRSIQAAGIDPMTVLATAPPGYRLNVAEQACDIGRFTSMKKSGHQLAAAGKFEEAIVAFDSALGEWHGVALADLRGQSFADEFAVLLEDELLATQIARAEAEIACGRADAVIGDLTSLTNIHPLHEPLWAQLITAFYLAERPTDALDALRRLKHALSEELGVDPGPPIRELELKILRQEPLAARPAAPKTPMAVTVVSSNANAMRAQLRDTGNRTIEIGTGSLRIGRMSDNNVVLEDDMVSRYHAVIQRIATEFVVRDLWSSNGVTVNGQRVVESTALVDGDHVQIGSSSFRFEVLPPT
ncbi:BTAD domain-containing putative transcriptional regulator [Antrihabitans sp. YC2-6]|uniref:BTAD domain-containing putative transcriptional regulator n=1 Tax=Antrihabitans sp. YC2-6 TaxID=2799498 RepID=UPI0018F44C76|nr:BTAD domain-containing putative transcriptional regulator [Antrihabitans sp. YC2-6]MBJ8343388.1 FHA domain-containing protein [Antrihabitans sp. YC2-6]